MLKRSRALASVALVAIAMGAGAAPAGAETLQEAIGLAYRTNPTLLAQRANQRALDETIVQARSSLRPTISASGSVSYSRTDTDGLGVDEADGASASVSLSQDLWTAGRTARGIDAAEANVRAGRENLREVEQQVMTSVIQAYADVVRDMEILRIRQENLAVLRRQLEESNARFEVGEITRTDVSQAEARLAGARSEYAAAQAALTSSRAAYEQVVGQAPGSLLEEPPLPALPPGLEEAFEQATEANPDVIAAAFAEEAARAAVRNAKGSMLPTVSLSASLSSSDSYSGGPFEFDGRPFVTDNTQVGGRVSIPLFSGGLNSSNVRAARQNENGARFQLRDTERRVREVVATAWSAYLASELQTQSTAEQVRANELAYEGVEAEAAVGLRTTLDVLNAEQELLNARLANVQAQRNAYVAGYAVLQALGRVTAENLALDVEVYDPGVNLSDVRRRYLGIGLLE